MCGRYSVTHEDWSILDSWGIEVVREDSFAFSARYNLAPTQPAPVLYTTAIESPVSLGLFTWGLLPDTAYATINARAETLAQRPTFGPLLGRHRCLIPADGFYEWGKGRSPKVPNYIHMQSGEPFLMAGLHTRRTHPKTGEILRTFTIITTAANELMMAIPHDRMPAILDQDAARHWLDPSTDVTDALSLLRSYPAQTMQTYLVSAAVNNWRHDTPDCILPTERST